MKIPSRARAPATAAAILAAAAIAGCGGSSTSSSSSSTAAPARLTKSAYEQKIGPLLNGQIAPAITKAFSGRGAANPQNVSAVITQLQTGHDAMAAVKPPTEIAAVHTQAVAALAAMIGDAKKLRDAESAQDRSRIRTAAASLQASAQRLQNVGNQFSRRGY